jgi:hypothetical protein
MSALFARDFQNMSNGFIIPALALLPNLIYLFAGKSEAEAGADPKRGLTQGEMILTGIERAGQAVLFVWPCFLSIAIRGLPGQIAFVLTGMSLLLYDAAWIRYFLRGRPRRLLFANLFGIPLPLAAAAVAYFLFASVLLQSSILFFTAVLFGAAHLTLSWRERQHLSGS